MIGVLLVTHGKLAEGLKDAVELIMGQSECFLTEGLFHGDDFEELKSKTYENIVQLDTGEGVLVLVDLFGASPYNSIAYNYQRYQAENRKVRLISGVNLPMLIEALDARSQLPLEALYLLVMETAKDNIKELESSMLERGNNG
jgi:PTS system mannose-specific IIA component